MSCRLPYIRQRYNFIPTFTNLRKHFFQFDEKNENIPAAEFRSEDGLS